MANSTIVRTPDDLGKLFAIEVSRFSAFFPHIIDTKWRFTNLPYTLPHLRGYRDVAYAEVDQTPKVVVFHPKILGRLETNVVGVIRHELGHVADPYVLTDPGREQRADNIAQYVTGQPIYYDQRDMQTLVPSKYPRPLYLHR